jgi:hypothetical protein
LATAAPRMSATSTRPARSGAVDSFVLIPGLSPARYAGTSSAARVQRLDRPVVVLLHDHEVDQTDSVAASCLS